MYYNRNLITASEQAVTRTDASGVFDLQTQAVSQNEKDWPGSETAAIIYDVTLDTDHLTIQIPSAGSVNYTIDWGDGTIEASTSNLPSHTYSSTGSYKIKIFSTAVYRPYVNNNVTLQDTVRSVEITENANLGTTLQNAFTRLSKLHTFKCAFSATSSVTSFQNMFNYCTVLSQIDLFDTSSGTNFGGMFFSVRAGSFPALNTSSATNISGMYRETFAVTELPAIDTSNVTNFGSTWWICRITTFPSFYDFSSATSFNSAWRSGDIYNFPANMFNNTGTLSSNAFENAFNGCRLTAQSIKNILTSLDANNQPTSFTGAQLHIGSGGNADIEDWDSDTVAAFESLAGDPSDANDTGKGWTIIYNSNQSSGTLQNPPSP